MARSARPDRQPHPSVRAGRCVRLCMRLCGALLTGLCMTAAPGQAQVQVDGVTVRVTKADCLRLVKHEPAPDVDYRPGTELDSDGEPIVPPDLYGRPRLELPETVTIPIEVDLAERYGLPPDASFEGDAQVGTVEIELDSGRASFNGQPLTAADEAEIRALCVKVLRDAD